MKAFVRNGLPRPRYEAIRRTLRYGVADLADRLAGRSEDLVPPRRLNFVGGPDYKATGDEFLRYFIELAGLEPHHDVLDLGCGIGRMARPLTAYLGKDGSYHGIDVDRTGIDWCNARIGPRFPNFRFQRADIVNRRYNPGGSVRAVDYRLPFDDDRFDLTFLTSVFTHMVPAEVDHYLAEISRTLKPGGACLITWFLWNPEAADLTRRGKARIGFEVDLGTYRTVDRHVPEDAISLAESDVLAMYRRHRLDVELPVRYGSWCGRTPYLSFQDVVVARKSPSAEALR